jgi:integrase
MRWSELVGLRRGKLDVRGRKVRVTEQLVQLEDRSFLRKERKTSAGVRSITLSPFTATMIAAHIDQRVDTGADALVFANAVGKPLSASSFLTHHFGKAQTAASVSCRFHDPRHASVALATAAVAHPKSIQSRMYGHSSPSSMKRSPRPRSLIRRGVRAPDESRRAVEMKAPFEMA